MARDLLGHSTSYSRRTLSNLWGILARLSSSVNAAVANLLKQSPILNRFN
jgi:hypothetical protein